MKGKIYILFLMLLICLSAIVIFPRDFEVEAAGGEDSAEEKIGIGLDFDFMWEVTEELSNVIHNKTVYPDGSIPNISHAANPVTSI